MTSQAIYQLDVDFSAGIPVLAPWLVTPDPQGVQAGSLLSYRWEQSLDGAAWEVIPGETRSAFDPSALDADRLIRVQLSYRDGQGNLETLVSAASTLAHRSLTGPLPFEFDATAFQEDSPIRATVPSGTSVLSYQWQRQSDDSLWMPIGGANAASYTPVDADADRPLRLQLRYAAGMGLTQTVYLQTDPIVNLDDQEVWTLQPQGALQQGQILDLVATSAGDLLAFQGPDDPRLTIQWQAWRPGLPDESEDLGISARSLQLGQEHVGRMIRAVVSYEDPGLGGERVEFSVVTSGTVANINDPPQGELAIDGSAMQREILWARQEFVDPDEGLEPIAADRLTWQWFFEGPTPDPSDDVAIVGATSASLELTQDHVNQRLKLRASYTDAAGFKNNIVSAPTEPVQDLDDEPTGHLLIQGDFIEGQTLTLIDSTNDADGIPASGPDSRRYQWLLDGEEIIGESVASLKLSQLHLGLWNPDQPGQGPWGSRILSARVSWVDQLGNAQEVFSRQSGPIRNVNDLPTGEIGVQGFGASGQPRERDVLSADLDLVRDIDGIDLGSLTWSWWLAGAPIAGAEGPDLAIDQTMIGKRLSVRAGYVDDFGAREVLTRELGVVLNQPDPATGSIWIDWPEGLVFEQGVQLRAGHDLADEDGMPDPSAIVWTWHARYPALHPLHPLGFERLIGSGPTLTLGQAEVGAEIQLRASFVDRLGGHEQPQPSEWTFLVPNIDDPPDLRNLRIAGALAQDQTLELSGSLVDLDLLASGNPSGQMTANDAALSIFWEAVDASGAVRDLGSMGLTLRLDQEMVGARVQARISYVDHWGVATERTVGTDGPDAVVRDVNDPALGVFEIELLEGQGVEQGARLGVAVAIVDADEGEQYVLPARLAWQWMYEGPTSAQNDDVPIAGANAPTLLLGQQHVGQSIKVRASYRDAAGFDNVITSQSVGPIADVDDPPEGEFRIEGDFVQGQILRLIDTIKDPDGIPIAGQYGAKRYVWLLDGQPIAGEPSITLALTQEHVGDWWDGHPDKLGGRAISAVLEYTDGAGMVMQITAHQQSDGRVRNINDAPTGPEVFGDLIEGETLSVVFGSLKDADGVDPYSVIWEWFADNLLVGTGDSLPLSMEHIDKPLSLKASYIDGFGKPEVLHAPLGVVANRPDMATGELWITIDQESEARELEQGATLIAAYHLEDLDFPEGAPEKSAIEWTWYAVWPADQEGGVERKTSIGTGDRLTLTQEQVGAEIELRASFTDPWGEDEGPFTARAFGSVADRDDEPSGTFDLGGMPRVGQPLMLTGSVADLDSATPRSPQGLLPLAALEDLEIVWQARAPDAARDDPDAFHTLLAGSEAEFLLNASLLGHQLRAQVSWTDGGGFRETITTEAIGPVLPQLAILAGQIYHWRSHALMAHVEVSLEPLHAGDPEHPGTPALSPLMTSADGRFNFEDLALGAYQLTASRPISAGELSAAINSADAMAALKLALGRNPNPDPDGPGPLQPAPVSPYQLIAADLNGDGQVDRSDAQAILRMATGQADARATWQFIPEGEDFLAELVAGTPRFEVPSAPVVQAETVEIELSAEGGVYAAQMGQAAAEGYAFPSASLVAVLRGDVDGSWAAPPAGGGATLQGLAPAYFLELARAHPEIVHPAQFWVF